MAYVSQELKTRIAILLRPIMPKGWKWTMSVQHSSTLSLNIASAPVDLISEVMEKRGRDACPVRPTYHSVNPYFIESTFSEHAPLFKKILDAMNDGNYDNSDLQTDYHNVGWYVAINIGRWDKPFEVK